MRKRFYDAPQFTHRRDDERRLYDTAAAFYDGAGRAKNL